MKKTNNKFLVFIIAFILFLPLAYSNGGCVKIADDIFVQMSVAPQVPIVNEKASFLFSFGNESGLVRRDINGKIKIVQNDKILLENDFKAKDGILDLKHEFKNHGLYEIFLEFKIDNKKYAPEDFMVEVIEKKDNGYLASALFLLAGFLIGILSAKLFTNKK